MVAGALTPILPINCLPGCIACPTALLKMWDHVSLLPTELHPPAFFKPRGHRWWDLTVQYRFSWSDIHPNMVGVLNGPALLIHSNRNCKASKCPHSKRLFWYNFHQLRRMVQPYNKVRVPAECCWLGRFKCAVSHVEFGVACIGGTIKKRTRGR